MGDRERRLLWLVGFPALLGVVTLAVLFLAIPVALQFETIAVILGLYAGLTATVRAVFLTVRADDVGALESERTTIALALVTSIFFLGWRLWAVMAWILAQASQP
jgi:hypothetical protein